MNELSLPLYEKLQQPDAEFGWMHNILTPAGGSVMYNERPCNFYTKKTEDEIPTIKDFKGGVKQ